MNHLPHNDHREPGKRPGGTFTPAGVLWVLLPLLAAVSLSGEPKNVAEKYRNEPIRPIPSTIEVDRRKAALGHRLFHDPRLSHDNTVSCAHCHPLERGGTDGLPRSVGIKGTLGDINAPTVLNSSLHIAQFWDGRAATLEEQIDGPVHNPKEMGSNWKEIISKLSRDREYRARFEELYDTGLNAANIKDAIATFERTLLTPDSRFDRFLRGDEQAITDEEKKGYLLFKSYGCASCHQGMAVGGNMYEKMGIVRGYFAERGNITRADYGRFNVTGLKEHRFEFKVPSLRNVELTAPYFHDGTVLTLEEAVSKMAYYQLGREIPPQDRDLIVKFLKTLTGRLPEMSP